MPFSTTLRAVVFFALFLIAPSWSWGESLQFPLTIPLPLLRNLIAQSAYPLAGEQAKILDSAHGCNQIVLSHLQLSEERGYLRFQTKVSMHWGTPVRDSCLTPFTWEGSVVLWQRPRIDGNWRLSFATADSAVFDKNNQPMHAVDLLWSLIKDHVHAYVDKITVNLAPPVSDVKAALLPMFDRDHQATALQFLASMQPDRPLVHPESLNVNILADIALPQQTVADQPVPQLSPQDYSRVMSLWRAWDDFLVLQLKQFAGAPLSEEERRILLNTMLTTRYAFTDAIEQNQLSTLFVRQQFLWGWSQLEPIFRNHLLGGTQTNILGYLAFFTANDALRILDSLGPAVGVEISEDGFRRLAALISTESLQPGPPSSATDQRLRQVLGLEPLPDEPLPTDKPIPLPATEENDPTSLLQPFPWRRFTHYFGLSSALAADQAAGQQDIREWTAEFVPPAELLPKVRDVLHGAATTQQDKLAAPAGTDDWFVTMILASAWQESCFRQFRILNKTITYTLSSNQTSVGIMQINEQIWRGVYNTKQLRWNIGYNSQAGCEIMALYLRDYMLKEKAPVDFTTPTGQRFLAAWLYALYNGGPAQMKPFLQRYKKENLYRAEQLFLAKFDAVATGAWTEAVHCLP
jgi:hypothetical protein